MKIRLILLFLLGAFLILLNPVSTQVISAQNSSDCEIEQFIISPDENSYAQGVSIELHGSSNCGSVHFEVDGIIHAATRSTSQYMTLQTNRLDPGRHNICLVAQGTRSQDNVRECERIIIRGSIETSRINYSTCPTDFTRTGIGDEVTVSDYDPSSLTMRSLPGTNQSVVSNIPINTELTIINGPVCANGWRWYETEYGNQTGWVGEVGPQHLFSLIPPNCAPHFVRLRIGDDVQVTEGLANRVRSGAGLEYEVTDSVFHGTPLSIIGGPICNNGWNWWEIEYGNQTGWTVGGDYRESWLEKRR